jgi:hypothetical protein
MTDFNIIYFIIGMLSMAEMSIQMVTSQLAYKIKTGIGFNSKYLTTLSNYKFWVEFLGWFAVIPVFFFKIYVFFKKLLDCIFCTGYHAAWLYLYLFMNMPLLQSLLLAPVCLVFVAILDKIHS